MEEHSSPRSAVAAFRFRNIHPHVHFGTASDRYAGWLGQIFPESVYKNRLSSRRRNLDGRTFEERTLPVESVQDYFEHFSVLELDFTFYRPLRDAGGSPSNTLFVLQKYAEHAPDGARFLLKAPELFFARTLRSRRGGKVSYEPNPSFLNAEAYVARFHEPAVEVLGERLAGIIFEQGYQRVSESPSPEENLTELDDFFRTIPNDVQAHLEIRSEHLLVPAYFTWLADRGLGHVFSHWTWLPPIRRQWRMCGERFTAANGEVVARLLTPLGMRYAEAYALAHPFDRPVQEITDTQQARDMVLDAVALALQAERQGYLLDLILNNRAWGNAPALAQTIGHRILDELEKDRPAPRKPAGSASSE